MKKQKPESIEIGGVVFKPTQQIEWEDAFSCSKQPIKEFIEDIRKGAAVFHKSWGLAARVNNYLVILHEYCRCSGTGDFTVIPLRPKIRGFK